MSETIFELDTMLDQSDMRGAITEFPNQIKKSFSIMSTWKARLEYRNIENIMVLGMGGSAIGGDVARVLAQNANSAPIIINRSYNIPEWVGSNTLILACSYSGGTEETLSAFAQCRERNCPIIVISTGGIITDYADKYDLDRIHIPSGYQPRAALGFSFSLILILLNRLGFVQNQIVEMVEKSIESLELLSIEMNKDENKALAIAENIHTTCPIIYGSEELTWVAALRFRGQLAENAKMLSFHNHFPEQNHNEIEGWTVNKDIMNRFSIIWLKDEDDHSGTQARMQISSALLESSAGSQLEISQTGKNRVERLLKLIHFTDWISYYAALLNNVDPTPVNRIQELKLKISEGK
ncbi:MAG TPA: bifunctional phosphoglucose/phosphomannose isomerase [Candidatus Marinimicrobia bacterium]|jgi:glucose/mannose-6-phosphate isomerase|nr:bifunctional phosphoglucose/phosphomannose isomerase [Candidatus Neomarinimicrobiota bacterium]